jgi:hypothetical protein
MLSLAAGHVSLQEGACHFPPCESLQEGAGESNVRIAAGAQSIPTGYDRSSHFLFRSSSLGAGL